MGCETAVDDGVVNQKGLMKGTLMLGRDVAGLSRIESGGLHHLNPKCQPLQWISLDTMKSFSLFLVGFLNQY